MTKEQEPARAAVSGAVELETELRAGLEGVTPGPWRQCGGMTAAYRAVHSPSGYIVFGFADASKHIELGRPIQAPGWDEQDRNARHIARCSPENIAAILDALATLRADNERLGRERDADIDALHGTFSKPIAVLQERVEAAEAERDTLLAQVGRLSEIISRYGNRMRMSYAPSHLQQDIDDAFTAETRAALTKEPQS